MCYLVGRSRHLCNILMQVKAAEDYRDNIASPEAKANVMFIQGETCLMSHKDAQGRCRLRVKPYLDFSVCFSWGGMGS